MLRTLGRAGGGIPATLGLRAAARARAAAGGEGAAWARDEIDRFVLARLEEEGLAPSPEADARALAPARHASTSPGCRRRRRRWTRFVADQSPRRLRARRRPPARVAALRRADGASTGSMSRATPTPTATRPTRTRRLAVARLGHPRVQRQPAVRPVHHVAARRRPAAERDARAAARHRVSTASTA